MIRIIFLRTIAGDGFSRNYESETFKILRKHNNLKKISPHGFRHTHASLLFEAGVTAKIISDRLGHNNVQTTLDMYTHINDNQRVEVVNQLMDFIRSS